MSRFNWMLAILAVALIALNALLSAPAVVEREATGPVFAELAAAPNVADTILLEQGDQRLHLRRLGQEWVVEQAFDFPAESHPVTQLLARLGRLSWADREGRRGGQDFYGFEAESAVRLELRDAAGNLLVSALQGRGPEGGPLGGTYLTLIDAEGPGADAVFAAAELPPLDLAPRRWWRGRLIEQPADAVTGLAWQRADGVRRHLRRVENVWRVLETDERGIEQLGRAVNSVTASQLVDALTSLYHTGVERSEPCSEMGFEVPALTLDLELGETVVDLRLAGTPEDGGRFACTNDLERPFVVRLSAETVGELEALLGALESRL
ncbi:MAG: hypothetical protein ACYS26_08405 [Planctomycetota bacterium]|jgi:hypothetical protein